MKPTKNHKTAARREGLRRNLPRPELDLRAAFQRPEVVNCLLIGSLATVVCAILVLWSLSTPKVSPGQVATENRLVRLSYEIEDREATLSRREEAKKASPRVYEANASHLLRLRVAYEGLPLAIANRRAPGAESEGTGGAESDREAAPGGPPATMLEGDPAGVAAGDADAVDDAAAGATGDGERVAQAPTTPPDDLSGPDALAGIEEALVSQFGLNATSVRNLLPYASPELRDTWRDWVANFFDRELLRHPLLSSQEFQVFITTANRDVPVPPSATAVAGTDQMRALSVDTATEAVLRDHLVALARAAGVDATLAQYFATPFVRDPKPTLIFNEAKTLEGARAAAERVLPVTREYSAGDRIFLRGNVLTEEQVARAHEEARAYLKAVPSLHRWLFRAGVVGSSALLISILLGYLYVFNREICLRLVRLTALFGLILGLTAAAAAVAIDSPWLLRFAGTGACIVAAIIITLAYDRQLAMFVSMMHCLIMSIVLEQGVPGFLVLFAGCALTIAQLREVRHRTALLRACAFAALAMGLGTLLVGPLRMPPVPEAIWQVVFNALWSAGACIAAGFVMLGVLPTLERMCDITTGLTLAELRDPKQPLLRQLQQKAPGTYNHSLQIANIAEAAAEKIGANGLLVYVGALYHDIGKMNKPDYFVENQAGGVNKHDRLSPAMSLLVIVGHVKDGIELAREYGLPRSIRHFIESHHGTTLVEYFFNAARSRAEAEGAGDASVDELAYRYPGPKPRTKEAAILMISDAVESATRALAEPTPSRIESVVRTLARKRLDDGQFNDCDLTLRELTRIEESLIKSVCAIYHGRISYAGPTGGSATNEPSTASTKLSARSAV